VALRIVNSVRLLHCKLLEASAAWKQQLNMCCRTLHGVQS
jgi:hypothetical protein